MLLMIALITLSARDLGLGVRGTVIIMLRVGACEAAAGLALLVLLVRSHGNDRLRSLTGHRL